MKFTEDPRIKAGRRNFGLAWLYYTFYLLVMMGLSYLLGTKPYVLGLPRWVAVGNILVPVVFVVLLIFVVERFVPDISLTDDEDLEEK